MDDNDPSKWLTTPDGKPWRGNFNEINSFIVREGIVHLLVNQLLL